MNNKSIDSQSECPKLFNFGINLAAKYLFLKKNPQSSANEVFSKLNALYSLLQSNETATVAGMQTNEYAN